MRNVLKVLFADYLLSWKQSQGRSWKRKPYRGEKGCESISDANSVQFCCTPMMSVKVNSINNHSPQTKVKQNNSSVLRQWTNERKIQQPHGIICWYREEKSLQHPLSKLLCSEDILVPNGSFLLSTKSTKTIIFNQFQEHHFKVLVVGCHLSICPSRPIWDGKCTFPTVLGQASNNLCESTSDEPRQNNPVYHHQRIASMIVNGHMLAIWANNPSGTGWLRFLFFLVTCDVNNSLLKFELHWVAGKFVVSSCLYSNVWLIFKKNAKIWKIYNT